MNIAIFGLGYVGCVSAACLAEQGFGIVGVDVNPSKLQLLASGSSPIVEPGLSTLLARHVASGGISVTNSAADAIGRTDLALVCVGTPGRTNGSLDLTYVRAACEEIGAALRDRDGFYRIVVRSTMLPGTIQDVVIPVLEQSSGKLCDRDFVVAINPEFLREGTALEDFLNPPFTLIGSDDVATHSVLKEVYAGLSAPIIQTSVREAEMVKYACNCFHALKVAFANEIGNICKASGIDSHAVMDAFCRDEKLNLSAYYLKPGFAFGGSCLPKDLRALNFRARQLDLDTPLLGSVLQSNQQQIDIAFERIVAVPCHRILLLGLSFKPGTDDLRESPMVSLAERLIGKGYDLRIFDREVELARLVGANKHYIENEIPHISRLLADSLDDAILEAEVIVIAKKDPSCIEALIRLGDNRRIVDLARIDELRGTMSGYDGLCW